MLSLITAIAFVLGAVVGSFLNVCIYRIPEGQSIVSPPSHCPKCGQRIRWYQNVPVVSWLILRGRCSACGVRIPIRYLLVEVLTGILFVLVFWRVGLSWALPVFWCFVSAQVVITFIDLDHQIIPDVISLPGIVVGFACSFVVPWLAWVDSLLGVLLGGGLLFAVAWGYELLTKREGMGGGDIKLLAMIGAFLGWKAICPVIFFASLMGTLVGVPLMLFKKEDSRFALPFGPFLAGSALLYLFCGVEIVNWYLSFYR